MALHESIFIAAILNPPLKVVLCKSLARLVGV